jgi:epoxyqueuosine reductase
MEDYQKEKTMKENDFTELLPACCRIGFASIEQYDVAERHTLEGFLPDVRTVVVVAHHVMHSLEWTWFAFPGEPGGEICPADLHTKAMTRKIEEKLGTAGYGSVLLPYPGPCGVQFKTLATRTGLGQLGNSFLFMNVDWGPWMHLRVLLTDAPITFEPPVADAACTHCGRCLSVCPSGAITANDFDGLKCRDGMKGLRNSLGKVPYLFECEKCLRACPIGTEPREVLVSYRYQTA